MNEDIGTECFTCQEVGGEGGEAFPSDACPSSKRPCGHHCNSYPTNDICHWCGGEFVEGPDGGDSVWVQP